MKKLSSTQLTILQNASERTDGNIEPLPDNINAGIKQRVIDGLLNRQLIDSNDDTYIINDAGWDAIGKPKPVITVNQDNQKRPREGSKLALIVTLLEQEGGVTLEALCDATQWQQHTMRGTFAGSLKKRFDFTISSTKKENLPRHYFIESPNNSVD